ncbi:MAG: aldehyde dehydrogenase family protein [Deltaproteobacteria bacterium]|nr:aldehyde dehydrogenase family protein [Deltaproteobacteria bacterium]
MDHNALLDVLDRFEMRGVHSGAAGSSWLKASGKIIDSVDPTTGQVLAQIQLAGPEEYEKVVAEAHEAFLEWRMIPAPKRGEIIDEVTQALREHKEDLGLLISLEAGKIRSEGLGEVQEAIDIGAFSVGLSRQLYGLSMHSERPEHRMFEQWHPLGAVGVITSFNFPIAVWAWNAMIAAVAGDSVVWKPSSKTPLCAIATHKVADKVMQKHGWGGLFGLLIGDRHGVGGPMVDDVRLPLISATGSTEMGRSVGVGVAKRFGRSLLELGGNNAVIVDQTADQNLALSGVLFGAVGTAGQRCTSTRRLFLHESIADSFIARLTGAYKSLRIGDPLLDSTLVGPLIDEGSVKDYERAIRLATEQGGEVLVGGKRIDGPGSFVEPALVRVPSDIPITKEETFAPILYVSTFKTLSEAIFRQNDVPQGLSSAIFSDSVRASENFLSAKGSDCGIANVNVGTSGAEIGGAFGGEKETGGGRESGSDSWKIYMRRQTNTVNWSTQMPLAQGVKFDL